MNPDGRTPACHLRVPVPPLEPRKHGQGAALKRAFPCQLLTDRLIGALRSMDLARRCCCCPAARSTLEFTQGQLTRLKLSNPSKCECLSTGVATTSCHKFAALSLTGHGMLATYPLVQQLYPCAPSRFTCTPGAPTVTHYFTAFEFAEKVFTILVLAGDPAVEVGARESTELAWMRRCSSVFGFMWSPSCCRPMAHSEPPLGPLMTRQPPPPPHVVPVVPPRFCRHALSANGKRTLFPCLAYDCHSLLPHTLACPPLLS